MSSDDTKWHQMNENTSLSIYKVNHFHSFFQSLKLENQETSTVTFILQLHRFLFLLCNLINVK